MAGFFADIKRKLLSSSGETIGETLVALLIIVAMVAALATAIVTAQTINKQAGIDASNNELVYAGASEGSGVVTFTDNGSNGKNGSAAVNISKTDNGYYYYEAVSGD